MKRPDDTLLHGMAEMAFGLGMEHGKRLSKPKDSEWLMGQLRLAYHNSEYGVVWSRIHRLKLRQVYGAGFDISRIMKRHGKSNEPQAAA